MMSFQISRGGFTAIMESFNGESKIIFNEADYELRPKCEMMDLCGGCSFQGTPYPEQLKRKEEAFLSELAANKIRCEAYDGFFASPQIYEYRNKMEYTFGNIVKDAPLVLGMHKKKQYMSIVPVENCQLVDDDFNIIVRAVKNFCLAREYSFYNKKWNAGLMRNLIVRRGMRTGELFVNIVVTDSGAFDADAFKEMLLGLPLENSIVGILLSVNNRHSDTVRGSEFSVIWGRDYYMEKVCGLKFSVSAFSFFQPNVAAAERLYSYALGLIDDFDDKLCVDLYSGTGTITQIMAKKAKHSIGVEIVEDAARAAKSNAELNGIENCSFIADDVLKALDNFTDKPDIIVVDPPRNGIHPKALGKIIAFNPPTILYISCNPKTCFSDVKALQNAGYRAKRIAGFDNFPFTDHIEAIVLLSKLDSKNYIRYRQSSNIPARSPTH